MKYIRILSLILIASLTLSAGTSIEEKYDKLMGESILRRSTLVSNLEKLQKKYPAPIFITDTTLLNQLYCYDLYTGKKGKGPYLFTASGKVVSDSIFALDELQMRFKASEIKNAYNHDKARSFSKITTNTALSGLGLMALAGMIALPAAMSQDSDIPAISNPMLVTGMVVSAAAFTVKFISIPINISSQSNSSKSSRIAASNHNRAVFFQWLKEKR